MVLLILIFTLINANDIFIANADNYSFELELYDHQISIENKDINYNEPTCIFNIPSYLYNVDTDTKFKSLRIMNLICNNFFFNLGTLYKYEYDFELNDDDISNVDAYIIGKKLRIKFDFFINNEILNCSSITDLNEAYENISDYIESLNNLECSSKNIKIKDNKVYHLVSEIDFSKN